MGYVEKWIDLAAVRECKLAAALKLIRDAGDLLDEVCDGYFGPDHKPIEQQSALGVREDLINALEFLAEAFAED